MKKQQLLFKLFYAVLLFVGVQVSAQDLTHSYVFENDTVVDVIGGANATMYGDATATDGVLTLSGTGLVDLPAEEINIASYESVTFEAVFTQVADLNVNTILFSFGTVQDGWMGVDYFLYQPTVGYTDTYSAAAITTGEYAEPWYDESYVTGDMIADTLEHYVAITIDATALTYYMDGSLVGTVALADEDNALSALGIDTAFLGGSIYTGDATWEGSISKFNIYSSAMTADQVTTRAQEIFGESLYDPTLKSITSDVGVWYPEFESDETDYEIIVPYGVKSINFDITATNPRASVLMYDLNDGTTFEDGAVTYTGEGIDLGIDVVAMDGITSKTYYIAVLYSDESASAELSEINLSTGSLTTDFDSKTTEYEAYVPYGTESVDVSVVTGATGATVEGDGTVAITDGSGTATIVVTSQDETTTKTYTINFIESTLGVGYEYYIIHEASSLAIGESGNSYNTIRLYNPALADSAQLFHIVESDIAGQYFIQNKLGHYLTNSATYAWDLLMTDVITEDQDSCLFMMDEFEPGRFRMISVARYNTGSSYSYIATDGTSVGGGIYCDKLITNDYGVWNFEFPEDVVDPYDTYLASLEIADVYTYPTTFDKYTSDYYVTVPVGMDAIDISATASDATASVSGAGTFSLDADTGMITITVTATDASYSTEYYIHYQKDVTLTLKHSYTFADGTAKDMVGDADGTIMGGSVIEGAYLADEDGDYIELPGDEIAINTYPSFTVEAYIVDDASTVNESSATMLAAFGDTYNGWLGVDYFFLSAKSRAAITCGDYSTSYDDEDGVTGVDVHDDGYAHHLVGVVTNDSVSLYLDGSYIGSDSITSDNIIRNLSTAKAYLCASLYPGDPTYLGYIYEFNIYAGVMDAQTVYENSQNFPVETSASDATLATAVIGGDTTMIEFSPYTLDYSFKLPEGTTEVPAIEVTATNSNATVVVEPATSIPGVITVTVTSEDEAYTSVYTFTIEGVTAVNTPEIATMKVYPTFSKGSFTIEAEQMIKSISVYDLSGQLVLQKNVNTTRDELSISKAGMYLIRVEGEQNTQMFKVMKTN